jgi:hypothetical protein
MERRRASIEAVAAAAEVDPKTVGRWVGGRVPHPRHRWAVAKFLGDDEEFLWPGARRRSVDPTGEGEIVAAYPYRSDVPTASWWDLLTRAHRQIDLLGYTLYFLPMNHPQLIETLKAKCDNGCRVRAAIAHPDSKYVADRDAEEDMALTLVVRIKTSLRYFEPLFNCAGFDLCYQDVPLYNSVFRFDDEMFVTPHLYATPGVSAPLLHLRRLGAGGMFDRFAEHFERIWTTTTPVPVEGAPAPVDMPG